MTADTIRLPDGSTQLARRLGSLFAATDPTTQEDPMTTSPVADMSQTIDLDTVSVRPKLQYGVAAVWGAGHETVVACDSERSAEKYAENLLARPRPPKTADVVRREVVRVYGPWEDR